MVLQGGMGLRKSCFMIDIGQVQCRNIKEKKLSAPDVIFDTVHTAADQEAGAGKNVSRVG